MRTVIELAQLSGWLVFHDADSRKNQAGLPDLVLTRDGVLVLAELKTATGKERPAQRVWLEALDAVAERACGAVVVRLWRPADWPEIEATLRRPT